MDKTDYEQMAFSFFGEEKKADDLPAAKRDFDTEDDALDALISATEETDDDLPPWDLEPTDDETVKKVYDAVEEASSEAVAGSMAMDIIATIREVEQEENEEKTAEEPITETVIETGKRRNCFPPMSDQNIRRAAAAFLAAMNPDGIGFQFQSGIPRIKIDTGAFFLAPGHKNVAVDRTILAVTCLDRDKCWTDAARKEKLLQMLAEEKQKKADLEEILKQKEPDLKDDSLFPESQIWDFSRTKNRKYHACLRNIGKLEHDIYHGSKFERLVFEQTADEYYLVVPENLITADELPAEWGLVYADEQFRAKVIRHAEKCSSTPEKRIAFAIRCAASTLNETMIANGISISQDGTTRFHPLPKRRKPYSAE